jgi:two-component system CheB/CheR fusion protein
MSSSSTPFVPRPPTRSRRVLLVEDNPDGRESLRLLLEMWGHRVKVAADGQTGVALGLAWNPEAALIDLGLPLLDGFQVARRLREALGDEVLLIAVSGYDRPEHQERGRAAGFNHHLSKPADPDTIYRLLAW